MDEFEEVEEIKPEETREKSSGTTGSVSLKKSRRSIYTKAAAVIDMTARQFPVNPTIIAETVSLPEQTVRDMIERFEPIFLELRNVGAYRTAKTDLLAAVQLRALKSGLEESKLKKSSALSCMQIFEIANKAERLETGKATEINNNFTQLAVLHLDNGTKGSK